MTKKIVIVIDGEVKRKGSLMNQIFYTREYVQDDHFQAALRKICHLPYEYIVCCSNGTVALYLGLRAMRYFYNWKQVTISPLNFIGVYNACLYNFRRDRVKFSDVDLDLQPILVREQSLDLHLGGIANKNKVNKMLDGAHSLGLYFWQVIEPIYDIVTLSFDFQKHLTTGGEGGAILTNSKDIYNFLNSMIRNGIDYSEPFYPRRKYLSLNFKMSNVQKEIGLKNLEHFSIEMMDRRNVISDYIDIFSKQNLYFKPVWDGKLLQAGALFYPVLIRTNYNNCFVVYELNKRGICARINYPVLNLEGANKWLKKLDKRLIALPINSKMNKTQIKFIYEQLLDILRNTRKL